MSKQGLPYITRNLGYVWDKPIYGYEIIAAVQNMVFQRNRDETPTISRDIDGEQEWYVGIRYASSDEHRYSFKLLTEGEPSNGEIIIDVHGLNNKKYTEDIPYSRAFDLSTESSPIIVSTHSYERVEKAELADIISGFEFKRDCLVRSIQEVIAQRKVKPIIPEVRDQRPFYIERSLGDIEGEIYGADILDAVELMQQKNNTARTFLSSDNEGEQNYGAYVEWKICFRDKTNKLRSFNVLTEHEGKRLRQSIDIERKYISSGDKKEIAIHGPISYGYERRDSKKLIAGIEKSAEELTEKLREVVRARKNRKGMRK